MPKKDYSYYFALMKANDFLRAVSYINDLPDKNILDDFFYPFSYNYCFDCNIGDAFVIRSEDLFYKGRERRLYIALYR